MQEKEFEKMKQKSISLLTSGNYGGNIRPQVVKNNLSTNVAKHQE